MSSPVIQIAADVISRSSRENLADMVLREALASRRLLTPGQLRDISGALENVSIRCRIDTPIANLK